MPIYGRISYILSYTTSYVIVYGQAGHLPLPAPNPVDSRTFTRGEHIPLDHQRLKIMNASDFLIQDMLHNPEFNAGDVDHNMHERLMRAVEDVQMDKLDIWQEGNGEQHVQCFKHRVGVVLRELLADERLKDCHFYALKLQSVQARQRRSHPWGSCKRICLFSNCPVVNGSGKSALAAVCRRVGLDRDPGGPACEG